MSKEDEVVAEELVPLICHDCGLKTDTKLNEPCEHVIAVCKASADSAMRVQMDADITYKNNALKEEREHCALIVEDPIEELKVEATKVDQSGGDSSSTRHLWAVLLSRAEAIRKQPVPWQFKNVVVPPEDCPNCQSKKIKQCKVHHATPAREGERYWRCTECHHHWEAK